MKREQTTKRQNPGSGKHTGGTSRTLKWPALEIIQDSEALYLFKAKASQLFSALSINRRIEDKIEGYQRALSVARVEAVMRYLVERKKPIPGAIIICLDKGSFDKKTGILSIPPGEDVGWVIDGQHRLAGASLAASKHKKDIEMAVVAFLGLDEKSQIEQFVTINREAKNVPTSLYLDLLQYLPHKNPADAAKERAVDLATVLRRDESSPFFERIAVTTSPKAGQLSLANFVRKIAPQVVRDKGILGTYTEREQAAVISNYYKGIAQVFSEDFKRKDSIFFKTIGFGAMWNVFQNVFSVTLKNHSGFTVKDVIATLKNVQSFDFSTWSQYGTGNQAELNAGDDFRSALFGALNKTEETAGSLRV